MPSPQPLISRTFVLGADIISQTTRINSVSTSLVFQSDAQGSTRLATDLSGQIAQAYNFDAYGSLLAPPSVLLTNILYDGEYFDAAIQKYRLRARDYDPTTGRFMTSDPKPGTATTPATLHRWGFGHANPTNLIDPSGNNAIFAF